MNPNLKDAQGLAVILSFLIFTGLLIYKWIEFKPSMSMSSQAQTNREAPVLPKPQPEPQLPASVQSQVQPPAVQRPVQLAETISPPVNQYPPVGGSPAATPPALPPASYADLFFAEGKQQLANHNEAAARVSLSKAVEAGNPQAMVLLGLMNTQGLGGPVDFHFAVELFRQAADLGYPRGMYNLGLMYEAGRGVPKDLDQARKYYEKAGIPEAARRLEALAPPSKADDFRRF